RSTSCQLLAPLTCIANVGEGPGKGCGKHNGQNSAAQRKGYPERQRISDNDSHDELANQYAPPDRRDQAMHRAHVGILPTRIKLCQPHGIFASQHLPTYVEHEWAW